MVCCLEVDIMQVGECLLDWQVLENEAAVRFADHHDVLLHGLHYFLLS